MSAPEPTLMVYVTCPAAVAEALATTLVEQRVAACVNVVPEVRSVYRWQGAVEQTEECLLLIKTAASRYEALEQQVRAHHPYELPEIVAVSLNAGFTDYLRWVQENST